MSADIPQSLTARAKRAATMRFGSLILAVTLLAVTGVIGLATVEKMKASRGEVLHTYLVRGLLKDLRADIAEAHVTFDLFELSRNPGEGRDLEKQSREQLQAIEELRELTNDNPAQRTRLDEFGVVLNEDIQQLQECVASKSCLGKSPTSQTDQMALISARRRMLSAMLHKMEDIEADLLHERLANWDYLFNRLVIILTGCFILALVLLVYSLSLLLKEIERRKEQERIEQKNAESYRMLSARILELQDMERRKIARELHDSVGQFLAGLKMNLGRLQRHEAEPLQANYPLLLESIDLTERAITEVRTISHLLHPPLLDELGFHSAARWYTEGFAKRSGVEVDLKMAEIAKRLPREIELALFRVLQESLTNVHRHAKASHVDIELECSEDAVALLVRDNGHGIKRNVLDKFRAREAGGIGLAGMRERLAELDGNLEVKSGVSGTEIKATLPIHECAPEGSEERVAISPE